LNKAKATSPKPSVRNTAGEVCRYHDLFSSQAPGYSQQVLDKLLVSSKNTSAFHRIAEVARKDQRKLGRRQLKLEELWLKVELRVLSREQAVEEFPELSFSKVWNPVYKSVYECWEETQGRLAKEQQQEGSDPEGEGSGGDLERKTMRE